MQSDSFHTKFIRLFHVTNDAKFKNFKKLCLQEANTEWEDIFRVNPNILYCSLNIWKGRTFIMKVANDGQSDSNKSHFKTFPIIWYSHCELCRNSKFQQYWGTENWVKQSLLQLLFLQTFRYYPHQK